MTARGHSEGITMSGGGLYSLATIGARDVIDAATPLVIDAINDLPLASIENGFTLSDMGTPMRVLRYPWWLMRSKQ